MLKRKSVDGIKAICGMWVRYGACVRVFEPALPLMSQHIKLLSYSSDLIIYFNTYESIRLNVYHCKYRCCCCFCFWMIIPEPINQIAEYTQITFKHTHIAIEIAKWKSLIEIKLMGKLRRNIEQTNERTN